MIQYVCPQCGSKYLKINNGKTSLIFTVGREYRISVVNTGDDALSRLAPDAIINCAACSWSGQMNALEISDL